MDVDLDSLPIEEVKFNGQEMVVEFQADGFENDGTFWTDSNGLELQKRVLNYRPTWDLESFNGHSGDQRENITWNYYPINSIIAL